MLSAYLQNFLRPVDSFGNRVNPEAFRHYRRFRDFLGPCCLCPIFMRKGDEKYIEAAVFVSTSGTYSGEYVAQCAKGECGYLGQHLFHGFRHRLLT